MIWEFCFFCFVFLTIKEVVPCRVHQWQEKDVYNVWGSRRARVCWWVKFCKQWCWAMCLPEGNTDAKTCFYRSGPFALCCQHKMDFQEVDDKKAWQTAILLVANNFIVEHRAGLLYTQPSASPGGIGSSHTTRAKWFLETRPQGETLSMNILPGAAKWLTMYISLFCSSVSALGVRLTWGPHKG